MEVAFALGHGRRDGTRRYDGFACRHVQPAPNGYLWLTTSKGVLRFTEQHGKGVGEQQRYMGGFAQESLWTMKAMSG